MMNFSSMFNQWRTQNNSGVTDLLSQPGVTMGRLLDEESFQGEYKSGNAKLTEFMKYPRYEELIELVTVVGPADDKKRSYKYPLSACEILSLDNNTALDFFLPEKPITIDNIITETVEVETEEEVELSQTEQTNPTEPNQPTNASEVAQAKPQTDSKEELKEQTSPLEKEAKSSQVPQNKTGQDPSVGNKQTEKMKQTSQTGSKGKTKKVIKKELKIIEKTEKKEVPPLILKLLAYFDGQINYTLAGYVSKIMGTLLIKRPSELMKYFLEENTMHKIINHAESRSVGEIIIKVLTHQSTHFLEHRRQFFKELLNRTSTSSQIQIISNLSTYICQIIEKIATNLKSNNRIAQFNDVFFSLDIITQVIKNVMSQQQNVAVYNAPILLTYLTNVPFVLPEQENIVAEFMRLGELFIEKSCEKLDVQRIDRPKLGFGRIKIIQILKFVLKENILNSKEIVAKTSRFFPILLKLIREYDMNNVLHNEVMKIVDIALTEPQASPLNEAILRDDILLTFIVQECEEDTKIKAGVFLYSARKGFIAHVINLCVRLRELSENNQNIKQLTQNSKFTGVYESFAQKEVFNSKKSLAGLIRKQKKHEIMFQKEDIIAQHLTFLQKCPSPIFQPEPAPDQVNIEHPDLVEELQKQLQENLSVKSSSSEDKSSEGKSSLESESKKVEVQVQGQGRYWATHLEYNIDDLIADL